MLRTSITERATGSNIRSSALAWASSACHPSLPPCRTQVQAGPGDTKVTTLFGPEWPDAPFRVLRNRVVEEWADKIDQISDEVRASGPIGTTTMGADPYEMPKFSMMMPIPAATGDFEEMALAAGESVGVVHDIVTVADVVARMMADAEALITGRLTHLVRHD